eukprot:c20188_g1_i1 orf=306-1823(+)
MANYSTSWTLPPSFMPCGPSSNGSVTMPVKPLAESLMNAAHSPHCENGTLKSPTRDDGMLYVTIHQAKHIHNICIYGNQDVYAKFLLTHCLDAVYPTQPVKAGGQNPVFNQSLQIPVCGLDSVLKCELWMMSCARNYLEDQLLGFVLVPLKTLYGKGKQTREYCLTSTDLFHTPAGTVHLSLAFFDHGSMEVGGKLMCEGEERSLMSEGDERSFCPASPDFQEVMMDCGQQSVTTASLCKVEFLDLEAASEDQHLVSMYYKLASGATFEECNELSGSLAHSGHTDSESEHAGQGNHSENDHKAQGDYGSTLEIEDPSRVVLLVHVRASSVGSVDDEMLLSPREEECVHVSPYLSGLAPPSAMHEIAHASLGEDLICGSPLRSESPTSLSGVERTCGQSPQATLQETQEKERTSSICQTDQATPYSAPVVTNAPVEAEITINQEHFVDLYLKSMQQFTDKLADMKFSFDIDAQDLAALRSVQVDKRVGEGKKKEGSKLYYGSRAFY